MHNQRESTLNVIDLCSEYCLFWRVVPPRLATIEEMLGFHAKDYIDFLTLLSHQSDEEKFEDESEQYGLSMKDITVFIDKHFKHLLIILKRWR